MHQKVLMYVYNLSNYFLMLSWERGIHIPRPVVDSYVSTVYRCIYAMWYIYEVDLLNTVLV